MISYSIFVRLLFVIVVIEESKCLVSTRLSMSMVPNSSNNGIQNNVNNIAESVTRYFEDILRPKDEVATSFQSVELPVKFSERKSTTFRKDGLDIPMRGIIDYKGKQMQLQNDWVSESTSDFKFIPATSRQKLVTNFNLWRQYPWKKINGKVILKFKVGGSIPIEAAPSGGFMGFGGTPNFDSVGSLNELSTIFQYSARDPRIHAVLIEIDGLECGYAKLQEIRKEMKYFRDSGKLIIGYCAAGAEKEFFLSLGCDEFFVPPDGGLDLRGFAGSASFIRGVFDKVGIEPQVQRIGKYKSFGDTFNRTSISEAQREIISSLLMETSSFWSNSVANALNKSNSEVLDLWAAADLKTPYDFKRLGYISGVRYLDQVEDYLTARFRKPEKELNFFQKLFMSSPKPENETAISINDSTAHADFDTQNDFIINPRRPFPAASIVTLESSNTSSAADIAAKKSLKEAEKTRRSLLAAKANEKSRRPKLYAGGLYLRKMKAGGRILQGLPINEVFTGPRIGVINAVGGISSGKSGSGVMGKTLGSDTLISLIRAAKDDKNIRAVVLRIDSPGGSALASDLMWREIRLLSKEKPVVACQVDVAASGGYYLSMACDCIVAEDTTITGSIGVVTSKFNIQKLNEKIGFNSETLSIGRYAEVLSSSRGFTDEESAYFEEGAKKAYKSFVSKAAASRNMTFESMQEVAQGRVWTGRQALQIGLVDDLGGYWKALTLAAKLCNLPSKTSSVNIQTLREPKSGIGLAQLLGRNAISKKSMTMQEDMSFLCDEAAYSSGLLAQYQDGFTLPTLINEGIKYANSPAAGGTADFISKLFSLL